MLLMIILDTNDHLIFGNIGSLLALHWKCFPIYPVRCQWIPNIGLHWKPIGTLSDIQWGPNDCPIFVDTESLLEVLSNLSDGMPMIAQYLQHWIPLAPDWKWYPFSPMSITTQYFPALEAYYHTIVSGFKLSSWVPMTAQYSTRLQAHWHFIWNDIQVIQWDANDYPIFVNIGSLLEIC